MHDDRCHQVEDKIHVGECHQKEFINVCTKCRRRCTKFSDNRGRIKGIPVVCLSNISSYVSIARVSCQLRDEKKKKNYQCIVTISFK